MTPEKELSQYRAGEKFRGRRARTTAVVFIVLATIGVAAFIYAFYVQTAADRSAREHQVEIQVMSEVLNLTDERAAKFEMLAKHEKKVTDSLSVMCEQKP